MTHIRSIATFPTMAEAYDRLTKLYAEFRRVHQRGEKISLFLASSGDPKKPLIELRTHAPAEHAAEAEWFAQAVKTL